MPGTSARRYCLAAGTAALAAFAWAIVAYANGLAIVAMLIAVPMLSAATGRRWLAGPLLLLLGAIVWAAFGTIAGYFWLNRDRLEALVAAIEAVPAITSLQLGYDASLPYGMGRIGRYDSYRFINGQPITQHREQMAPTASQPTLREIDVLRELGVSFVQYGALRESLGNLLLAGFDRRGDGEIALNEVMPAGTPWGGASIVYRPGDGPPSGDNLWNQRRLAPHWFHLWPG
jgi:hypothetical protein